MFSRFCDRERGGLPRGCPVLCGHRRSPFLVIASAPLFEGFRGRAPIGLHCAFVVPELLRRECTFEFGADYSKSGNCGIGLIWSEPCL